MSALYFLNENYQYAPCWSQGFLAARLQCLPFYRNVSLLDFSRTLETKLHCLGGLESAWAQGTSPRARSCSWVGAISSTNRGWSENGLWVALMRRTCWTCWWKAREAFSSLFDHYPVSRFCLSLKVYQTLCTAAPPSLASGINLRPHKIFSGGPDSSSAITFASCILYLPLGFLWPYSLFALPSKRDNHLPGEPLQIPLSFIQACLVFTVSGDFWRCLQRRSLRLWTIWAVLCHLHSKEVMFIHEENLYVKNLLHEVSWAEL